MLHGANAPERRYEVLKNSMKSFSAQERNLLLVCFFLLAAWAAGIALFLVDHPAVWQKIADFFVSIRISIAVAMFNAGLLF